MQRGNVVMIMKHALMSLGFAKGLFWSGVVVLIIVQVFALSAIGKFYARLRRRYPDIWMDVGRPTLPRGPKISEIRLTAFLRCRDFRRLGDESLNNSYAKYATLRKVSYVPYALCAAGALLFVWDKLIH